MCSNIGTPSNHHFPFGTNGKVVMLGVTILKHFRGYVLKGSKLEVNKFVVLSKNDLKPGHHTCQVVRKSKSETACSPLVFVYNLVIECTEKSGAQVLRVRFFALFKQT